MHIGDRPSASRGTSNRGWASRRGVILVGCCLLACVGALALVAATTGAASVSGTGPVDSTAATMQDNDTTPPRLHSGTKVNDTTVSLLFVDDTRMNVSSITANDFLTSDGQIAGIDVDPETTNASVQIHLASPVEVDELVVGVRPSTNIQDTVGNVLDTENGTTSVTISDMDGVPPEIIGTNVGDATGKPATISFSFDEKVSQLDVSISGPAGTQLTIDDFENVRGNTYVAEYVPPEAGQYTVELQRIADQSGNRADPSVQRTFQADLTRPTAVIGLDLSSSDGTTVTFDASKSTGNALEFHWEFGDGDTASGQRVTHEYVPGLYTVTLEVSDGFGHTDTATLELNLTNGIGSGETNETVTGPSVVVDRSDSASAVVSVTGALRGQSFVVGTVDGSGQALVAGEAFSLDGLSVTPASNATFSLALSSVEPESVRDAETLDGEALGGVTVISALPDDQLSTVEFTLTVPTSVLDSRDIAPEDLAFRRADDGRWESLDLSLVEETADGYRFRATAPGFSRFALVATGVDDGDDDDDQQGTPSFDITETRLSRTTVTAGESVRIEGDIENTGDAAGDVTVRLGVNGTTVETEEVTGVEPGESATVTFTHEFDQPGTATLTLNENAAGTVSVESADNDSDSDTNGTPSGGETNQTTPVNATETPAQNPGQFNVSDVTLNTTSIAPGGTVRVEANVTNTGETQGDFVAELAVDGTVVETRPVPKVPGGATLPVSFTRSFNESGTYTVSVSGAVSESRLSVGNSGGGGLFGIFGVLPLGFLPWGLLRPLFLFVIMPLLVVYGALKGVAFYLGY